MLIRAMVLYLRIRYNIFLRHNIAFTDCLHIKGELFFFLSFYFYCLVLVNPMIISNLGPMYENMLCDLYVFFRDRSV